MTSAPRGPVGSAAAPPPPAPPARRRHRPSAPPRRSRATGRPPAQHEMARRRREGERLHVLPRLHGARCQIPQFDATRGRGRSARAARAGCPRAQRHPGQSAPPPPPPRPRPPRPPPPAGSTWYATQRASAENAGAVAFGISMILVRVEPQRDAAPASRLRAQCSSLRSTYVTHLPSPEIDDR